MSDTVKLVTPKVETQESIVEILRDALAEAERGELDYVFMIVGKTGSDMWQERVSATLTKSKMVGDVFRTLVAVCQHDDG